MLYRIIINKTSGSGIYKRLQSKGAIVRTINLRKAKSSFFKNKILYLVLIGFFSFTSCGYESEEKKEGETNKILPEDKTTNLLGNPLTEPDWGSEKKNHLLENLEIAQCAIKIAPNREDSYIWLGRRYGYLTRWEKAIEVFTKGIKKFPKSYKLYRFRARHHARQRNFRQAIEDYKTAEVLMQGVEDSYEPDGNINRLNKFLSSYRASIYYYQGQTNWALSNYQAVIYGMERSMKEPLVQSNDHFVSVSFWKYFALRKLKRDDEAYILLQSIDSKLDLIENDPYHQALLMLKGVLAKDDVRVKNNTFAIFAQAMEHHFKGETDKAQKLWLEIINNSAQGFWPAETELIDSGYKNFN